MTGCNSHVSDDRGVRSIMRRRGEPVPQQQQPAAAAVPVGYPGYGQPYAGYGPQWGQPYPMQSYPPGPYGYPAGPYAQPAPLPHHTTGGHPTVPVAPVPPAQAEVPAQATPVQTAPSELPSDAAQIVPRVVATNADSNGEAPDATQPAAAATADTTSDDTIDVGDPADDWGTEPDW